MTHLSLAQITGVSYYETFEIFFDEADTEKNGIIPAMQAAKFLKRSGLSDLLLSKIWDQADAEQRGQLNKQGFFIALKLIALAQQGRDPSLSNLTSDIPPPKLSVAVDAPCPTPPAAALPTSPSNVGIWDVSVEERAKFEQLFLSISPEGARLSGEAVRPVLLQSGLGTDVLVTIWDLADVDKDGFLDKEEFVLAMNLTQRRLAGKSLPDSVPTAVVSRMKGHTMGFENNFTAGFGEFGFAPASDMSDIMRESEGLLKEVEEIKQQKLEVDMQVLQLESDLKLKQAEMKVMQRELDHMSGTYHQLEMQKEEAQKRLDEFGDTTTKLNLSKDEYDEKIIKEEETIHDLQDQLSTHEMSARSHEEEITFLRSELNELMLKENVLQEQLTSSNRQLTALQRSNQQSEEELQQAEAATDAVSNCKSQLEEVLGTLAALMRGEVSNKPLPPDEIIVALLEDTGPCLSESKLPDVQINAVVHHHQQQQKQQQEHHHQRQQQEQQRQQQEQQRQQQEQQRQQQEKQHRQQEQQQHRQQQQTSPMQHQQHQPMLPQAQVLPQHQQHQHQQQKQQYFQHQIFQGNEIGARPTALTSGWGPNDSTNSFGQQAMSSAQFRPASASPQPVQFPAHFPATAAAWPPVSGHVGGPMVSKSSSMNRGQHQNPPSLSAAPTDAPPTKTKTKKSKSPFSRSKKSREHSSSHHDAAVQKQEGPPSGGPPGVGDFADFSRFDGVRSKPCPSEDEQLAWAKMESQRIQRDEEKMRRQEEAELQYAIQLSKMNS